MKNTSIANFATKSFHDTARSSKLLDNLSYSTATAGDKKKDKYPKSPKNVKQFGKNVFAVINGQDIELMDSAQIQKNDPMMNFGQSVNYIKPLKLGNNSTTNN